MGDHNGKVGIEQKIYILPQNMGKKNFVFFASSEHKIYLLPNLRFCPGYGMKNEEWNH